MRMKKDDSESIAKILHLTAETTPTQKPETKSIATMTQTQSDVDDMIHQ